MIIVKLLLISYLRVTYSSIQFKFVGCVGLTKIVVILQEVKRRRRY